MNNPFTTNEAKLKRQATEAGNAFREALAEQPAQPSKPWVGLTDEDFNSDMFSITSLRVCDIATIKSIAKDVEDKLKERNA